MTAIRVGNAPCSWGALEFDGLAGERIGYTQMLDELRATGYVGTELGDWGFMTTDPAVLRDELTRRGLTMIAAFVPVALGDPDAHTPGAAHAVRVSRLMAAVSDARSEPRPLVVLADANGTDPMRTRHAGRITPQMELSEGEWGVLARGAERIAQAVRDETGLRTAFHSHCAGFVETPDETARLLDLTDPALLGLVFDTGHYAYGGGGAGGGNVRDGLARFGDRIALVHFKDLDPRVAAAARAAGWDYFEAIRRGLFCELGQGCIDFPAAAEWLRGRDYRGWIVVEQDVLPGMGTPRESAARSRAYLAGIGL